MQALVRRDENNFRSIMQIIGFITRTSLLPFAMNHDDDEAKGIFAEHTEAEDEMCSVPKNEFPKKSILKFYKKMLTECWCGFVDESEWLHVDFRAEVNVTSATKVGSNWWIHSSYIVRAYISTPKHSVNYSTTEKKNCRCENKAATPCHHISLSWIVSFPTKETALIKRTKFNIFVRVSLL